MKRLLLIMLMVFSLPAFAGSFMPENDLWMEDSLMYQGPMTPALFSTIIDAGKDAYAAEVKERGEYLTISKSWEDPTVNAYARRRYPSGGPVEVAMFGGLARRPELDARGFALVLCHELGGHLYPTGANYWKGAERLRLGSEGEADYSAAFKCFSLIADRITDLKEIDVYEDYINEKCGDDIVCKNSLVGSKQLANLLSILSKEGPIEFADMDMSQVDKTISDGYPPVRCRLTAYVFGTLKYPRPGCWKADDAKFW